MNDLRYAWRMLLKNPGFSAVAIVTLALGIGAASAAFSWIQSVLLRTVPGVTEPHRLAVLAPKHLSGSLIDTMSYPDLKELAEHKELFTGIVASQFSPMSMMVGAEPEWVWGQIVTANFFDILGVRKWIGRTFLPDEETRPGGHPVVVLSHAFWQRRFKGDSNIVGQTISLNRHVFTVVGVGAPDFRGTMGGLAFDLWAPVMMREQLTPGGWNPDIFQTRGNRWLHTVARLAPCVSLARAQAALDTVAEQWEREYPKSNRGIRYALVPMWKSPWGAPRIFLPLLSVLFAVTLLVLLIVAANIANLLLARATSREREIAVRVALGASQGRVIRQLLTESVVLSLLGAAAAVPCAIWLTDLTMNLLPTFYLPVVFDPHLDTHGLIFMLLVGVATGVLFGLAPAWQSTRPNLNTALKAGARGVSIGRNRLRGGVGIAEVALPFFVLICAGVSLQSFCFSRRINRGFDPYGGLLAKISLGVPCYRDSGG